LPHGGGSGEARRGNTAVLVRIVRAAAHSLVCPPDGHHLDALVTRLVFVGDRVIPHIGEDVQPVRNPARVGARPPAQPRRVVPRSVIREPGFLVALFPGVAIALWRFGRVAGGLVLVLRCRYPLRARPRRRPAQISVTWIRHSPLISSRISAFVGATHNRNRLTDLTSAPYAWPCGVPATPPARAQPRSPLAVQPTRIGTMMPASVSQSVLCTKTKVKPARSSSNWVVAARVCSLCWRKGNKQTELQQCRAKKSCNNKLTTSAVMRSLASKRVASRWALLRLISRSASYSRLPVIMGSLRLHRDVRGD
jgi:hypothetical protein